MLPLRPPLFFLTSQFNWHTHTQEGSTSTGTQTHDIARLAHKQTLIEFSRGSMSSAVRGS